MLLDFISIKNTSGLFILFTFLFVLLSCDNKEKLESEETSPLLNQGFWSAELEIDKNNKIPFLFEVIKDSVFFINGEERIGASVLKKGKQLSIHMPIFDSEFNFSISKNNLLKGVWINYAKGTDYSMLFTANYKGVERYGVKYEKNKASLLTGRWEVAFSPSSPQEYKAIGVFEENNQSLTGTFITETGDYRFLEGQVQHNQLLLSCFDGAHAFLFKADVSGDSLIGEFFSGNHYKADWKAKRNASFELAHPDSIVKINEGVEIAFNLPSLDESPLVYPSPNYDNKVVIIQVMGSWCPNCMDETALFTSFYDVYKEQDLKVISVAFETPKTLEGKKERVRTLKKYFNAEYDFAIGGNASKIEAQKVFPALDKIVSFPTAIFIDKKGVVRKVHTGFYGPGTGGYYSEYVNNTNAFIEQLLNE